MSNSNISTTLASEDWQLAEDDAPKPISLVVQMRRRAWVLPYLRWVNAEGDDNEVKITFASHRVTVTGHGMAALLAALATQRVMQIVQPTENEAKFGVRGFHSDRVAGPSVTEVLVEEFKQKG